MKQGTASIGRQLSTFTIADNSALRGKATEIVITAGSTRVLDFKGAFPALGGLSVWFTRDWVAPQLLTVTTTIDGVAIAAARDGTITFSAV